MPVQFQGHRSKVKVAWVVVGMIHKGST